jgi:hypothetical protein
MMKIERLFEEWRTKHPDATLEDAYKAGYLRHVDAVINKER